MGKLNYVKPEKIWLKEHPVLNEKWVQDRIAEDPSVLGLGDLVLKDKERILPKAGRLDLLFQDIESNRRYETEVQLGKTDESHLIRTIEYWDIERKRYPQYDHCAVIIAEDITNRFLNVISLFNGSIPLMAIQMNDTTSATFASPTITPPTGTNPSRRRKSRTHPISRATRTPIYSRSEGSPTSKTGTSKSYRNAGRRS